MYDYVFQTLLLGGNKVYLSIYLSIIRQYKLMITLSDIHANVFFAANDVICSELRIQVLRWCLAYTIRSNYRADYHILKQNIA